MIFFTCQISCWKISLCYVSHQLVHYNGGKWDSYKARILIICMVSNGNANQFPHTASCLPLSLTQGHQPLNGLQNVLTRQLQLSNKNTNMHHTESLMHSIDVSDQDIGTKRVMRKKIYGQCLLLKNCKLCKLWVKISFSISTVNKQTKKKGRRQIKFYKVKIVHVSNPSTTFSIKHQSSFYKVWLLAAYLFFLSQIHSTRKHCSCRMTG